MASDYLYRSTSSISSLEIVGQWLFSSDDKQKFQAIDVNLTPDIDLERIREIMVLHVRAELAICDELWSVDGFRDIFGEVLMHGGRIILAIRRPDGDEISLTGSHSYSDLRISVEPTDSDLDNMLRMFKLSFEKFGRWDGSAKYSIPFSPTLIWPCIRDSFGTLRSSFHYHLSWAVYDTGTCRKLFPMLARIVNGLQSSSQVHVSLKVKADRPEDLDALVPLCGKSTLFLDVGSLRVGRRRRRYSLERWFSASGACWIVGSSVILSDEEMAEIRDRLGLYLEPRPICRPTRAHWIDDIGSNFSDEEYEELG